MKCNRVFLVLILFFSLAFSSHLPTNANKNIGYIQFKEIKLENLLEYISIRYGVNVLADIELNSLQTTIRLKDVSVHELLNIICDQLGLIYTIEHNSYILKSLERNNVDNYLSENYITEKKQIQYAALPDLVRLLKDIMHGSVVVRSSTPNKPYANLFDSTPKFADSNDFKDDMTEDESNENSVLSDKENIKIKSSSTNTKEQSIQKIAEQKAIPKNVLYVVPYANENIIYLISQDRKLIQKAQKIIQDVDKPIKEVLIQGKIITVNLDDGFDSFFDIMHYLPTYSGRSRQTFSIPNGHLKYQFFNNSTQLALDFLEKNGKSKTIASPMLLTANRTEAVLDLVEDVAIIQGWNVPQTSATQGGGQTATQISPIYAKQKIGTRFRIIPYVNNNDEILLKIYVESSGIEKNQEILVPNGDRFEPKLLNGIKETKIQTTLVTKNGQGIILGGLISQTNGESVNKVPILGDIPILGFPFKQVNDKSSKTETILILTPIVTNLKNPKAVQTIQQANANLKAYEYSVTTEEIPDKFKRKFKKHLLGDSEAVRKNFEYDMPKNNSKKTSTKNNKNLYEKYYGDYRWEA